MKEEYIKSIDIYKIQKYKLIKQLDNQDLNPEQMNVILKNIDYVDQQLKKYYKEFEEINKLDTKNNNANIKNKQKIKNNNNQKEKGNKEIKNINDFTVKTILIPPNNSLTIEILTILDN